MSGHVRIENRFFEAIVSAPFSGAQMKIVLALYRLTAGWQRQSVKLTLEQLAQLCGYTAASGGFRGERTRLLDAGVVEFTPDAGRGASGTYRLQPDMTRWGKFAPAEGALDQLWGARPEHADQLHLRVFTVESGGASADESLPVKGQASDPLPASKEAGMAPVKRQATRPIQAGKGESSLAAAASSSAGKTVKDMKDNPKGGGRGEAMELLARIEGLKERTAGQTPKTIIRRDRIRSELGADVDEALQIAGGVERLLKTDAGHRGVLIGDFATVLERVRGRAQATA